MSTVPEPPATARHPFDRLALDYDARFTDTRLGRWLRERVHRRLAEAFPAGGHVLELGCGTGEDAVWLARRGFTVTATDLSQEMLRVASEKAARTRTEDRIDFLRLDLGQVQEGELGLAEPQFPERGFDGAFSNFGALNCLPERRSLAEALARQVRPGGRLLLVVMGPFCLWEILGNLARGRLRTATRRLRPGAQAALGSAGSIPVWYPSPRKLRREFEPWFRPLSAEALGLLLPPTDFTGLVERWPRLFTAAAKADERLATLSPSSWLGDHYLLMLERL